MPDYEAEGMPPPEDPPPGIDDMSEDEGIIPPGDRPQAALDWGTTAREELLDEPLADRVKREVPDRIPHDDGRVHGRLVEPDEGWMGNLDDEPAEIAELVEDDDAGLSAEEAALHIVDEP
jgi:hypothetical protein